MNLSQRSKLSICQFLTLFNVEDLNILLDKYRLSTDELEYHRHRGRQSASPAVSGFPDSHSSAVETMIIVAWAMAETRLGMCEAGAPRVRMRGCLNGNCMSYGWGLY